MELFRKVMEDDTYLPAMIEYYENEYFAAKKDMAINGILEQAAAKIPAMYEHRFSQLQQLETVLEFFEIRLRKTRSKMFKKYIENYNRELSSRDVEKYVDGEEEVVALQEIINQISYVRNLYLGITKGFDSKGWQVGNIARLRVAGLDDARIS